MLQDTFSFGLVKGREMSEAVNEKNIGNGYSGAQYLYSLLGSKDKGIREEVEYCLKKYSRDFIITFGKYKGKTLAEIDSVDGFYIEKFLTGIKQKYIVGFVNYYLKFCRIQKDGVYSDNQKEEYKKLIKLNQEINSYSSHSIELALYAIGKKFKGNGGFDKCPFCNASKKRRWPAYLERVTGGMYHIGCSECKRNMSILQFVSEQYQLPKKEATYELASALGIDTLNVDISDVEVPVYQNEDDDKIILQKQTLSEVSLKEFGFENGVMHPAFFSLGFTTDDMEAFDVRYAGRLCRNYMKDRICFPIRDIDGKVVGMLGRHVISRQDYYNDQIGKLKIDTKLDMGEQMGIVDSKNPYIEYMVMRGFKKSFALYNIDKVFNKSDEFKLFICSAPVDVMKLYKCGMKYSVGIMGSELSRAQLYLIFDRYRKVRTSIEIYLCTNEPKDSKSVAENIRGLSEIGFKNLFYVHLPGEEASNVEYVSAICGAESIKAEYTKKSITLFDMDNDFYEPLEGNGLELIQEDFLESLMHD